MSLIHAFALESNALQPHRAQVGTAAWSERRGPLPRTSPFDGAASGVRQCSCGCGSQDAFFKVAGAGIVGLLLLLVAAGPP